MNIADLIDMTLSFLLGIVAGMVWGLGNYPGQTRRDC